MKIEMLNTAKELMKVGCEETAVVPEWVDIIKDRPDIVEIDYGFVGRFMVVKCKTTDGLRFVFRETDKTKLIANVHHNFFMDVTNPLAKPGFTHFFEHMMFRRIKYKGKFIDSETLMKKAAEYGISLNAFTGQEGVVVNCHLNPEVSIVRKADYIPEAGTFRSLAKEFLNRPDFEDVRVLFDLVYAISYDHKFTESDVADEKRVVQSEIARSDHDQWALYRASNDTMFGIGKRYDHFGEPSDIDNITVQDCINLDKALIDGCTSPQTRHVLTGNFNEIPEVINMWIDAFKKVITKKKRLTDVPYLDREYYQHMRKLGGNNCSTKSDRLLHKSGKLLHFFVPNSNTSEIDMYCEFNPYDSKWNAMSNVVKLKSLASAIIVGMSGDAASPLNNIFREKLGWTYGVCSVHNKMSIQDDVYLVGWDMVLGKHVPRNIDTLKKVKEVFKTIEFNQDLVDFILRNRASKLLSGIDNLMYNPLDKPYSDNESLSNMYKYMDPLTDIPLSDWTYVWQTLCDSLYIWLLEGTAKREENKE